MVVEGKRQDGEAPRAKHASTVCDENSPSGIIGRLKDPNTQNRK
jgi:hypothetical protein